MKKRNLVFASVLLLSAMPILAQDDGHSKKTTNCSGTISADGQSFTCDKDHHVWKVANPAALRDLEGHQAKLTFRRTSVADEIFVTSAAVVQQQTAAPNSGDSAFRR
jgi:hypothetical protein